jgi:UDP-N-acetylglucosamine 2-epimerase (non-hydrolysing)
MKKIVIILGTRPEAIKLLPVYLELKKNKRINTVLVSTGQHREMLRPIFEFFQVMPHHDMAVMTANQSLDTLTAQVLQNCGQLFRDEKPDMVIVQGDTTTAATAALAAFYQQIPIAHVEAGLRSFNNLAPFPEEVNRRIVSLMTTLHFAPTASSSAAIRRERVGGKVFNVGNTVIDSLFLTLKKVKQNRSALRKIYDDKLSPYKRMILITGHRRENFGKGFADICEAIKALSSMYPSDSFIYPVHLNPNVSKIVNEQLGNLPNVFLIDPVPYDHMVFLMTQSYFILTDSGGIQEEAPALGKPVIVMRETTERPEGVKAGCCVLAGSSKTKIIATSKKLLTDKKQYLKMARASSPYGKGDSAKRIARLIDQYFKSEKSRLRV